MENKACEIACPLCDGKSFTDGFALGHAPLRFVPGPQSLTKTLFTLGEAVSAKKCDGCGHLLLFAKSS